MNASAGAPPNLTVNDDVRGPNLWITTLLGLSVCTIALAARAIVKTKFKLKRHADDWLLGLAYVFLIVQCALLIKALTKNLGTTLGQVAATDVAPMEKYFYAAQVIFVVAIYLPKLAMLHLLRSLFTIKDRLLVLQGAVYAACIGSILAAAAACNPVPGYIMLTDDDRCANRLARWIVVVVFDIITELSIIISCAYFLRNIMMRTEGKIKVMIAVSSRAACVVFALLFITSWSDFLQSSNPGTAIILPSIYQQCNVACSITLAATLPCFRILFQSSELIDYPLNPYAREAQLLHSTDKPRNGAPPGEVGTSEKRDCGKKPSSSTGTDSDISKTRTLTF